MISIFWDESQEKWESKYGCKYLLIANKTVWYADAVRFNVGNDVYFGKDVCDKFT